MIVLGFDAASLARVRLAPSPASEVAAWLRLLMSRRCHPLFGDPGPSARVALRHRDVALLAKVLQPGPTTYVPDLLTPKPPVGSWAGTLHRQLELIRATPEADVVRQLLDGRYATEPMPDGVRRAMESGTFAPRVANGLYRFWRTTLAEQWTALHDAVAGDLDSRARTMATHGVGTLLASLHPDLKWNGHEMRIDKPYEERTDLTDTDVVLAPSVLVWPHVLVQVCDPGNEALVFPIGQLPSGRQTRLPELAGILGASRARILESLDVPTTTTQLSRRHSLALSTVSYHLGALLRAGMVLRSRQGALVRYRRSEQGEALARTNEQTVTLTQDK